MGELLSAPHARSDFNLEVVDLSPDMPFISTLFPRDGLKMRDDLIVSSANWVDTECGDCHVSQERLAGNVSWGLVDNGQEDKGNVLTEIALPLIPVMNCACEPGPRLPQTEAQKEIESQIIADAAERGFSRSDETPNIQLLDSIPGHWPRPLAVI